MLRNRLVRAIVVTLAFLVLWPKATFAQTGAIAGVVKDTTGAVMPGVTVEAASPALIERVRTVVTDGEGQYKIVDLRPGTYAVTFALAGFSTVKRDGIDLSSGVTASVNAELRVGAIGETITVSGQAPMVDVQNTRQQTVIKRDVLDALPTGRSPMSYAVLVPGVISASASTLSSQDVGGSTSDKNVALTIHGSRAQEMPLLFDGMKYNNMNATPGGSHHIWAVNNGAVQEFAIEVGAVSAESEVAGVRQNSIPRDGGNRFTGLLFANYTNDRLQAKNVADPFFQTSFPKIWDINPAFGGPIRPDKLWFFGSYRSWGTDQRPSAAYYDTDPLDNVYIQDLSRPAIEDVWLRGEDVRFTWQASAKNKITLYSAAHQRCWCHWGVASTVSPDASRILVTKPNLLEQISWSAPITNKLLIDAGYTFHSEAFGGWPQPYLPQGTYSLTEQSTGVVFRALPAYNQHRTRQMNAKFFVSYVTGSHAFKVGIQEMHGWRKLAMWTLGVPASLQLLNGVPTSLTQYTYPYNTRADVPAYDGVFAQDQWTINRMTINAGVRFEWLKSNVPAQTYEATSIVPERSFPAIKNAPNWKDILPRLGVAYDLFGTGKTALKVSIGRYVQAVTTAYSDQVNPIVASVNQANRTWTDTNGNFRPDCDMTSVIANAECGALSNANFGKGIITTTYDPDFMNGWGKRPYDWEVQGGIQHELRSGLSVNATYTRHWWKNFLTIDNLATSPSDYSPFCVTAPVDSRLPGGGGNQICGFYDINPDKFGQVNNWVTLDKNYGNVTDVYNGVDLSATLRMPRGILLQGGTSTGREIFDNCSVVGKVDMLKSGPIDLARQGVTTPLLGNLTGVDSPSTLYCHDAPPFRTQVKLLGVLPLPWNVSASATFQSVPGPQITATYVVPNALIAPTLGRNLSAGARANATVELIEPGTRYGDRVNQLDTRFAKTFRLGGSRRAQAQADFYNVLNVAPVTNFNTRYGAAWLVPTFVLPGRMFKFGVQLDF